MAFSSDIAQIQENEPEIKSSAQVLPRLSVTQLINLIIGGIGLQFAWAMQINLTGRVVEPLGANAAILGLMWLAGPITGIIIQPVIGTISDNIWTKFGRRRPFLLIGAILGSLALIAFPFSPSLLFAASILWIIDACVNISQTPHRALVPDIAPPEQYSMANSFFSFGAGFGAIAVYGLPFFLKTLFDYQMTIKQQFIMSAIVLTLTMSWTCFTTKEKNKPPVKKDEQKENPFEQINNFFISSLISLVLTVIIYSLGFLGKFDLSNKDFLIAVLSCFVLILTFPMLGLALKSFYTKEILKLCFVQYFTWFGVMCLLIFFNNYVVHYIYHVPDLSSAADSVKSFYKPMTLTATNISGAAFAVFNAICLLVSIPLGIISNKFGKRNVHSIALLIMAIGFLGLGFFTKNVFNMMFFMGLAGVGWASVLALPYALLIDNAKESTMGSALGKFNLFIVGPQLLSSIIIGNLIAKSSLEVPGGITNHWEYAFIAGGASILIASLLTLLLREKNTLSL